MKPRINAVRPSRGGWFLASIDNSFIGLPPAQESTPPRPRIVAAPTSRPPLLPQRRHVTALGQHFEPQRALHRDRLRELDRDLIAEAIALAGRLADQRVGGLVKIGRAHV